MVPWVSDSHLGGEGTNPCPQIDKCLEKAICPKNASKTSKMTKKAMLQDAHPVPRPKNKIS